MPQRNPEMAKTAYWIIFCLCFVRTHSLQNDTVDIPPLFDTNQTYEGQQVTLTCDLRRSGYDGDILSEDSGVATLTISKQNDQGVFQMLVMYRGIAVGRELFNHMDAEAYNVTASGNRPAKGTFEGNEQSMRVEIVFLSTREEDSGLYQCSAEYAQEVSIQVFSQQENLTVSGFPKPCDYDPSTCRNGGQCTNTLTAPYYQCNCSTAPGFIGDRCHLIRDQCENEECSHHGTCVNTLEPPYFKCLCHEGYSGTNCFFSNGGCDYAFDSCHKGTCHSSSSPPFFRCDCSHADGYTGKYCEIPPPNPCAESNPCKDSACVPTIQPPYYTCECNDPAAVLPGCRVPPNPCAEKNPCQNGAECIPLPATPFYYCDCPYSNATLPNCAFPKTCATTELYCLNGGVCRQMPRQSDTATSQVAPVLYCDCTGIEGATYPVCEIK